MRLEEILEKQGIKKIDLAATLGLSPSTVSRWSMRGKSGRKPGWAVLPRLAQALNLSIESTMELFPNEAPEPQQQ